LLIVAGGGGPVAAPPPTALATVSRALAPKRVNPLTMDGRKHTPSHTL
jgi:hypothetical protein